MDKIVLDHVSYVYSAGTPFEQTALDDVCLHFRSGRITGIIGHTGSGKSTMMQLLNGLSAPTSGKVLLDGYDINTQAKDVFEEWRQLPDYRSMSKHNARKSIRKEIETRKKNLCFRVGLVMQYPEYQLFEETVEKDIAYGPCNMGLSEKEIAVRVREAAAFTGVEPSLFGKSPFDLSGGQKRRVAIAGVVAMRPEVLVLDEPAAGLDPRGRTYIFDSIIRYQKETGATVLIVSHSMEDMASYCDDVVVLSGAKVLLQGERREVFSHVRELTGTGLAIPQITRMMSLLKERGVPVREDVYTVEEALEVVRALFPQNGKGGGIR